MAQPEHPVIVSAKASRTQAAPGDTLAIAVIFEHEKGWHIHTQAPKPPKGVDPSSLIATEIEAQLPKDAVAWLIQWPKPSPVKVDLFGTGRPEPYEVFQGHAVAFLPVRIPVDAAIGSSLTFKVKASWQACDDKQCVMPQDEEHSVAVAIVAPPAAAGPADQDFALFDASVFATPPRGGMPSHSPATGPATPNPSAGSSAPLFDFYFWRFSSANLIVVLLASALGGFVLNLTPCVLPVVPLKVIALQNSAAHHPGRRITLGLSMFLGVTAFWLGLGLLIVSLKVFRATNELFGNPYFLLGVGTFIGVMALGMMGAFVIQLPQKIYMLNPSHDSIPGSFYFGIVTAILGTPCFGPFAGAAAGWATTQPASIGLAAFAAIGAGMGLPYLVLAVWPGLLGFVPRTGPASELVKQVMGLLLFAAAIFFLGTGLLSLVAEFPYLSSVLHWWGVAVFAAIAGGWLLYRTVQITRSTPRRMVFGLLGAFVAATGIGWAGWQTSIARATYVPAGSASAGLWKPYSPDAFNAATKAGDVVVVDFTADWCLNCKVMEATVLNRSEVKTALSAPGVEAFKADLTSRKAEGWDKLAELHEVGIPLLSITGPGLPQVWKSNAYSPSEVISTLDQAKGGVAKGVQTQPSPAATPEPR
jgi:thiol:disulfide interchange protein